jgi:hypothetical protein
MDKQRTMTPKVLSLHWWPESHDLREEYVSGARVRQLTSSPAITHDLYHEQPVCSADGNRLALFRTLSGDPHVPGELMVYDIERYRIARLEQGILGIGSGIHALATSSWSGQIYAVRVRDNQRVLWRFDLNTLESEELFDWGALPGNGFQTISPDGRWGLAAGRPDKSTFGIYRVDLRNGTGAWIHENPHIANPHLQYRLHGGSRILVQENRGCLMDDAGNLVRPFDERGVGLYSLDNEGNDRRDFPVGPPHTANTTGHECYIGNSDHVLVTLSAPYDDGARTGNIVEVRHEWKKPRVVFDSPHIWNHISASRCGRYFVADSYHDPGVPLLIGNIATGRAKILCETHTTGGGAQYTHAHPYLTSDNQWAVFNSNRTGLPQIYIARIPEDFLAELNS